MTLRRGGIWGADVSHSHQTRSMAYNLEQRTLDGDNLDTLQSELDVLQDEVRRLRLAEYKHDSAWSDDSRRLANENVKSIPDESPAMRLRRLHELNTKHSKKNLRLPELPKKAAHPYAFPSLGYRPKNEVHDTSYVAESGPARRPSYAEVLARSNQREETPGHLDKYEQDLLGEDFDRDDAVSAYITTAYGVSDYDVHGSDGENSVRCYAPAQTRM